MSKSIVIEINGVSETYSDLDVLQAGAGSGGVEFVPEDETQLQALEVTQNGTYTPGSGVYGFSAVTVKVQIIRGTINGVEYVVTVDSNGYLVYTEVTA